MSEFSAPPRALPPHAPLPAAQTRVRWDNIAMIGAGIAVVLGVTSTLMSWASGPDARPTASAASAPAVVQPAAAPTSAGGAAPTPAADDVAVSYVTDPAEVRSLVDEARDFIAQGRWDEAIDRLDTVAPELRAESGADAARAELTDSREQWIELDTALRSNVAALNWTAAKSNLGQLAAIAPLNDEQLALREQIQAATAPRVSAPTPTPAKPAAAATTTPAAAAATPAKAAPAAAAATPAKPVKKTPAPAASASAGGLGLSPSDSAQLDSAIQLIGSLTGG